MESNGENAAVGDMGTEDAIEEPTLEEDVPFLNEMDKDTPASSQLPTPARFQPSASPTMSSSVIVLTAELQSLQKGQNDVHFHSIPYVLCVLRVVPGTVSMQ